MSIDSMGNYFPRELKFFLNELPFQVIFYPTSRCNARCSHCYNYKRQDGASKVAELTLEEIEKICSNLGHVKVLTISGGEPFLRDDLKEIISIFHQRNGLQIVSFHTNAFLKDRVVGNVMKILNGIRELKVIVCVSFDGIGETHDAIRGVPNGFKKMVGTLKELESLKSKYDNLYLLATSILSQSSQDSFRNTISYIRGNFPSVKPASCLIRGEVRQQADKNIDISHYKWFIDYSKKLNEKDIAPLSPMAIKETLDQITKRIVLANYLNKKQTIPCQAGRKLVVIYENGDVYPCELIGQKFGNLRDVDYDIKSLLFSEEGKIIKKKIADNSCYCTWENIINANILFNPMSYPRIIYNWFRSFVLKRE